MANDEQRPWWESWWRDPAFGTTLAPLGCVLAVLPLYLVYRVARWVLRRIGAVD